MKPFQILVFLLVVLIALSGFQLLIPSDYKVFGQAVKVFNIKSLLSSGSDFKIEQIQKVKLQKLHVETEKLLISEATDGSESTVEND